MNPASGTISRQIRIKHMQIPNQTSLSKIEKNYLLLILFWIIWKITTTLVNLLGVVFFYRERFVYTLSKNLYINFCYWDSAFFHDIAAAGYGPNLPVVQRAAFPPVYPILIKIFSYLFNGNIHLSQYVVANLCFLIWILLMYYFIKTFINKNNTIAFSATIIAMVFPYNFFFMAGYSESIFMVFLMLFFITLYKKQYLLAAIFVGLGSTTRFVGIGLLPILLADIIISYKQPLKKLFTLFSSTFISLIPLGLYLLFLKLQYGKWDMFLIAQAAWNRKTDIKFIAGFYHIIINHINGDHQSVGFTVDIFNFSLLFLALFVGTYMIFKLKEYKYFGFFIWLMLIPALLNGMTLSMARLTIICFPVYYIIAKIMEKYNIPLYFLIIPTATIQAVLILVFNAGDLAKFLG